MSLIAEQLRAWAELLEGSNMPDLIGMRAGMLDVADDLDRDEPEPENIETGELGAFEPCGLYDDEIGSIIDNDDVAQATTPQGDDIARKDPETGDVWVLSWFRVRKGDNVICKLCKNPTPAATAHRHTEGYVGDCCWDERLRMTE
jgi:hypothetical protein